MKEVTKKSQNQSKIISCAIVVEKTLIVVVIKETARIAFTTCIIA